MSEAKHTPGPWTAAILAEPLHKIPEYVADCIRESGGRDFRFVAASDAKGQCDICHVGNGSAGKANARLIAAAPDLLEACKAVMEMRIVQVEDEEGEIEMCRAAIAKAEGRDA